MKLILTLAALLTLFAQQAGDTLYTAGGDGTVAGLHPGTFHLVASQWKTGSVAKPGKATVNFKEVVNYKVKYQVVIGSGTSKVEFGDKWVNFSGQGQCGDNLYTAITTTVEVAATPDRLTIKCAAANYQADGPVSPGPIKFTVTTR